MRIFYTTTKTESPKFIKKILSEFYDISAPQFFRNENGKPYLKNAPLFFNLSHSGGLTALAVGENEMGLDVQARDEKTRPAIERRLTERERREDFFRLWTAKEAYIKWQGESLARTYSALTYEGGMLFKDGKPTPCHLFYTELLGCALTLCTAEEESASLIQIGD